MDIVATLAEELGLKLPAVEAVIQLMDEGNTIPFIARYRKEATGGLDDVTLRDARRAPGLPAQPRGSARRT